jgi:hypothetical protein
MGVLGLVHAMAGRLVLPYPWPWPYQPRDRWSLIEHREPGEQQTHGSPIYTYCKKGLVTGTDIGFSGRA